ncbi:MAG: hypothetical protein AAF787_22750 [Chloroflexota bacterium]
MIDKHTPFEDIKEACEVLSRETIRPEIPLSLDFLRVTIPYRAKGLILDNVIIMGCIEGLMPKVYTNDDLTIEKREAQL